MMETSGSVGLDLSDVTEEATNVTENEVFSSEDTPTFSILPPEMKIRIFKSLSIPDKVIAATVCDEWMNLLKQELDHRILKSLSIPYKVIAATVCDEWMNLLKQELDHRINLYIEKERCVFWDGSKLVECPWPPTRTNQLLESMTAIKLNVGILEVHHVPGMMDFGLLAKALPCVSEFRLMSMDFKETTRHVADITQTEMKVLFEATNREDAKLGILIIYEVDWRNIISAEDLKSMVGNANIKQVVVSGFFTPEQEEAVKSIPQTFFRRSYFGLGGDVVMFDRQARLQIS